MPPSMKKSLLFVILCSILAVSLASLSSCEKYVLPELSANPDTLIFPATGGPLEMNVTSNVSWSIDIIPGYDTWLTCSPNSGRGDCTVTITAPANTGAQISKEYSIKSETITRKLLIIQEGI